MWQPIEIKPKVACVVAFYHSTAEYEGCLADKFSVGSFEPCPTVEAGYGECCDGSFDWDDDMPPPTYWIALPQEPIEYIG